MKKFDKPKNKFLPKIFIRRRTGLIALSKGFINYFNLEEGNWFVSLFYKKKTNEVGMKFSRKDGESKIPLKKYESNPRERTISAKNFLDFHGIDYYSGDRIVVLAKKKEEFIYFKIPEKSLSENLIERKLKEFLLEKAVRFGEFTLSSGKKSDFYVDCRKVSMDPIPAILIGKMGWEKIRVEAHKLGVVIDSVGGLTMGADPISFSIGNCAANEKAFPYLQTFSVRKEAKTYGAKNQIEGNFKKGDTVVIIEDVITTGQSALKAIHAIRTAKGKVAFVLALVDREEGGREMIEKKEKIPVVSLFTPSTLKI